MMTENNKPALLAVNEAGQLFAWYCGVVYILLFGVVMVPLLNWLPPPSPTTSAVDIIEHFSGRELLSKATIPLGYWLAACSAVWSVLVAIQISRLEGRIPIMAGVALVTGVLNAVAFSIPWLIWSPMFYRLDRAPELIVLFSDTVWLMFACWNAPFVLQLIAIAVAGLAYKGPLKVFPRWFCYMNIWVALLVLPGSLVQFFYDGPFAWNGILALWLPVIVYFIYYCFAFPIFWKAIKSHKYDAINEA